MPELKPEVKEQISEFITNVVKVFLIAAIAAIIVGDAWIVKQAGETNVKAVEILTTFKTKLEATPIPTATPSAELNLIRTPVKPVVLPTVTK